MSLSGHESWQIDWDIWAWDWWELQLFRHAIRLNETKRTTPVVFLWWSSCLVRSNSCSAESIDSPRIALNQHRIEHKINRIIRRITSFIVYLQPARSLHIWRSLSRCSMWRIVEDKVTCYVQFILSKHGNKHGCCKYELQDNRFSWLTTILENRGPFQ